MNTVRFWNVQSGDIVGGTLQLPGSSRSFAVNRDLTVQLPGNPRGIAFGADSKSFYALLAGGHTLSWNIDMARMHVEACRQLPMAEMRAEYCGGQRPQRKGTSK
jgi:hypothetical protein